MDQPSTPYSLATAAIEAAFDLVIRYSTSSDSAEVLEMNRVIHDLKSGRGFNTGDTRTLARAIRGLGTLGWALEFASFRSTLDHLRYSLPAICAPHATGMEISSAAHDLKELAGAATTLRAPDISQRVDQIVVGVQTLEPPRTASPTRGH